MAAGQADAAEMIEIFALYFMVAVPVMLATIGHLWGSSRRMHLLDILILAALIGLLWVAIPWWIKEQ